MMFLLEQSGVEEATSRLGAEASAGQGLHAQGSRSRHGESILPLEAVHPQDAEGTIELTVLGELRTEL